MSCAIGLYGLAVMGQNLALNIAQNAGACTSCYPYAPHMRKLYIFFYPTLQSNNLITHKPTLLIPGVRIAVCNRSPSKVDDCVARAEKEGGLPVSGYKDVAEFVAAIAKPRAVIILVQAGQAVDDTIAVRHLPT
jgi:6-phosphogluconate dehydrogenase